MSAPSSDQAAIRQTIRALREAGYTLTGGHNGEEEFTLAPDAPVHTIIDELTACDDSTLHTFKRGDSDDESDFESSFVYFVLGNEPFEVICDHGVSLAPVLDPLTAGWED